MNAYECPQCGELYYSSLGPDQIRPWRCECCGAMVDGDNSRPPEEEKEQSRRKRGENGGGSNLSETNGGGVKDGPEKLKNQNI